MKKQWKYVKDFEDYMVSTEGKVISLKKPTPIMLKPNEDAMGYVHYRLYHKDGGAKLFKGHRLVCQTFIPEIEGKDTVNHLDGDKKNNNVENLEWTTQKENMKHAWRNGLISRYTWTLTDEEEEEICEKYVPHYYSVKRLSEEYDVPISTIRTILKNGKRSGL